MALCVKKSVWILLTGAMVFFVGCGGGGTSGGSSSSSGGSAAVGIYKYNKITIAGSSITWGKGYLGEDAYLGEVEQYFREQVATTLTGDELGGGVALEDKMSYGGKLFKYGAGKEISGTITGDALSIAFAKERGSAGATVEVIVDGVSKGTFSTAGEAVQNGSVSVPAGVKSYDLGRAHTFGHVVSLGDATNIPGKMENGMNIDFETGYGFGDNAWMIVRKSVGKEVHHFINFKEATAANVTVTFKYGENIKPVKSSVDNVAQVIGSTLESPYGDRYKTSGTDTLVPTEGLDFRENDPRAVQTYALANGTHSFTLKVTGGDFILNFVTNHMYYFQNAGIGSATAADLLKTDNARTKDQIVAFAPDLFILESATNDANTVENEVKFDPSTNTWLAGGPRTTVDFTTKSANQIELAVAANGVSSGDVVTMGTYVGDNIGAETAVGIVSAVANSNKTITFTSNVNMGVAKKCKIKGIKAWEDNVKAVVAGVKSGVGKPMDVGIGTSGVPNLFLRQLSGYREKGEIIASQNGWKFFDFYQKTLVVNPGKDTTMTWSRGGDNTHPNDNGIKLFGAAVTEVLSR